MCSPGEAQPGNEDECGQQEWHKCHSKHSRCHIIKAKEKPAEIYLYYPVEKGGQKERKEQHKIMFGSENKPFKAFSEVKEGFIFSFI